MSSVSRMFTRRDKRRPTPSAIAKTTSTTDYFGGVFTWPHDTSKTRDKEEERKVKGILERLRHYGVTDMGEANVEYALRAPTSHHDADAAYRLLMLLQDTHEGLVRPYIPGTRLLGAVNREGVTCYLDALLFAMFSRLDSFEALLYDSFEDAPRRRLAGILRLWVNLLRTGKLITTDITQSLQDALAACGWKDAASLRQQDSSEAFTFITGKLELPLLTLKMDLYHTGKEDPQDDHKFVNERLLEVAILEQPVEGRKVITLEDCLESYFNNRIEVKRHMENQRRNTLKSVATENPAIKAEKASGMHIEVVELEHPDTPVAESPLVVDLPATPATLSANSANNTPIEKCWPTSGRRRADSIFSQRKVAVQTNELEKPSTEGDVVDAKGRKLSTRTEVLMPAWQFFKLLPWYTDHLPESDAQVAAHFSKKRPVLGICLKRYSYTNAGQAQRLDTYVDIPLEIAVPNFVSDDSMHEEGPLVGNFRLMLQSVVCHRGVSVHSGHYVCLTRGSTLNAEGRASASAHSQNEGEDVSDLWMRFDDLAKERVSHVDIGQALREEVPYLLFYQVQPIGDDGHSIHDLPTYEEATSRSQSDADFKEKPYLGEGVGSENALVQTSSQLTGTSPRTEATDFANSERTSLDIGHVLQGPRGRSSMSIMEGRRGSVVFDQASLSGTGSIKTDTTASIPSTPSEEKPSSFLAVAGKFGSRRSSRRSKSRNNASQPRPASTGPDSNNSRFSLNMAKLSQRLSRTNDSHASMMPEDADPVAPPTVEPEAQSLPIPESHITTSVKDTLDVANASQESVNTAKPPVSEVTVKKDKEKQKLLGRKRGSKGEEDRECVVM